MSENSYLEPLAPFDGVTVKYQGIDHILRYYEQQAIYPYEHLSRSAWLNPKDRTTKYYQETKKKLGDDWSIDVTSIPMEDYISILKQLGILEDVIYSGKCSA